MEGFIKVGWMLSGKENDDDTVQVRVSRIFIDAITMFFYLTFKKEKDVVLLSLK